MPGLKASNSDAAGSKSPRAEKSSIAATTEAVTRGGCAMGDGEDEDGGGAGEGD